MNLHSIRCANSFMLLASLFILSACGGGGGGSSSEFTTNTDTITFSEPENSTRNPEEAYIRGIVTGHNGNVFVRIDASQTPLISNFEFLQSDTQGDLFVTGQTPLALGLKEGTYDGVLSISVCSDQQCNQHINGSPKTIAVVYNVTAEDTDHDGVPNSTDDDDDNDGVLDVDDALPKNADEHIDTDGDGIGDNNDEDDDNDGVSDIDDAMPKDPTESQDYDQDGIGDNADTDDDGDSILDVNDDWPLNNRLGASTVNLNFVTDKSIDLMIGDEMIICDGGCTHKINVPEDFSSIMLRAIERTYFRFQDWGSTRGYCFSEDDTCYLPSNLPPELTFNLDITEYDHFFLNGNTRNGVILVNEFVSEDFHCEQECSSKIYKSEGLDVEFYAVPAPGYRFIEWTGDCSGNDTCVITSIPGSTVTLGINTAKVDEDLNLCPERSSTFTDDKGVTNFNYYMELAMSCDGYAFIADNSTQEVRLVDIINGSVIESFYIGEDIRDLTLDEENKLLFISEQYGNNMRRLDLRTRQLVKLPFSSEDSVMSQQGVLFAVDGSAATAFDPKASKLLDKLHDLTPAYRVQHQQPSNSVIVNERAYTFDFDRYEFNKEVVADLSKPLCSGVLASQNTNDLAQICSGAEPTSEQQLQHFNITAPAQTIGSWDIGENRASAAAFSVNGDRFAVAVDDRIKVFNTDDKQLLEEITFEACGPLNVTNLEYTGDEKYLIASGKCGLQFSSESIFWIKLD